MRKLGLRAFLVGLPLCVAGVVWFAVVRGHFEGDDLPRGLRVVVGLPMALGYVLSMVGLYRWITGVGPGQQRKGLGASLARIGFGLALTLGAIVLAAVLTRT